MTYTITSTIRGGGVGSSAWVARITGPDAKFGLSREFVRKDAHTSRSGRSGHIDFHCEGPGYYEFRNVQLPAGEATTGSLSSGFVHIDKNGEAREVNRDDVIAAVESETA